MTKNFDVESAMVRCHCVKKKKKKKQYYGLGWGSYTFN